MKKVYKYSALILLSIALVGCFGKKTANPVEANQPGDQDMSCQRIRQEIVETHQKIMHLVPKQDKTGKNVALGVTGTVLLVPLFFMDFSDVERVEIEAFQRRDRRLRILGDKKGCDESKFPKPIKFETTAPK